MTAGTCAQKQKHTYVRHTTEPSSNSTSHTIHAPEPAHGALRALEQFFGVLQRFVLERNPIHRRDFGVSSMEQASHLRRSAYTRAHTHNTRTSWHTHTHTHTLYNANQEDRHRSPNGVERSLRVSASSSVVRNRQHLQVINAAVLACRLNCCSSTIAHAQPSRALCICKCTLGVWV
jgi:hypothetical protein